MIEVFISWYIVLCIGTLIGWYKDTTFWSFMMCLLFGPLGLLIVICASVDLSKCPHCCKRVNAEASICPYCRSVLKTEKQSLEK